MLSANKEKLLSFFTGSVQFKIPFFQRAYVWKIENWSELWDNIINELDEFKNNNQSEHFIGTIIIKQTETERLGTLVYDLIDGQQRLTTICILLRALHDTTDDGNLKKWILDLLVFTNSFGEKNIRIIHSKVDKEYFSKIILSENDNEGLQPVNNKIVEGFVFFKDKISKIDKDDIRNIVTILLDKMPVIHMALSKDDDVQQIFDTINSLGVKLTAGELLKNHLFSSKELEPYYEQYWQSVFEVDEDAVLFWDKTKTSGRINRSTIELFLYSYLVIEKESIIKIESLFKEYKEYLKGKSTEKLILIAKEINEYAKLYEQLPEGENIADITFNEDEKRFFHVMNGLDITTVFPLALFIYKSTNDNKERVKILNCLESFIVRRAICKFTTKNYNNLFISILVDLKKLSSFTADDFKNKLLSYNEDSNRFPTDSEFKTGFFSSHLINQYSKEILYCIALYDINHENNDNRRLNENGFSVEHIMPKKWRNNWSIPMEKNEKTRDATLLTLGNLTLVKGKLNSSMRDSSWKKKKEALSKFSSLHITTNFLDREVWDEDTIDERANTLYLKSLKIWRR